MGIFSNSNLGLNFFKPLQEITIGDEKLDDEGEDFSVDSEKEETDDNVDDTTEEGEGASDTEDGDTAEPTAASAPDEGSDANTTGDDNDNTDDNFELPDDNDSGPDDTSGDGNEDAGGGDIGNDGGNSGSESDDNFDMGADGGTDDTSAENDTNMDDGEQSEEDQSESQLYDTLTDDQKKIRILQLKIDFQNLYKEADSVLNAINSIPKTEDDIETLRRLIETLNNVKKYVLDYVTSTFDKTTYLDNNQVYIKFIEVFRTIRRVIDDLSKEQKGAN